jgi:hypothetical protein
LKFFTRLWASGGLTNEETDRIRDAYWNSIETLLPHLPTQLAALATTNLHDSLPESVIVDRINKSILLTVLAGDLSSGYFKLTITYYDVDIDDIDISTFSHVLGHPNSELLFDEVDIVNEGKFVHRILFYPYGEFTITFSSINIERAEVNGRVKKSEIGHFRGDK